MLRRCDSADEKVVVDTLLTFSAVEDEPRPSYDASHSGVIYALRVRESDPRRRVRDVLDRADWLPTNEVECLRIVIDRLLDRAVSCHVPRQAPESLRVIIESTPASIR